MTPLPQLTEIRQDGRIQPLPKRVPLRKYLGLDESCETIARGRRGDPGRAPFLVDRRRQDRKVRDRNNQDNRQLPIRSLPEIRDSGFGIFFLGSLLVAVCSC